MTDSPMTDSQEQNLKIIKLKFAALVEKKYRMGDQEHGGNLLDEPELTLLDSAIDEAIDQVVYLITLRRKLLWAGLRGRGARSAVRPRSKERG